MSQQLLCRVWKSSRGRQDVVMCRRRFPKAASTIEPRWAAGRTTRALSITCSRVQGHRTKDDNDEIVRQHTSHKVAPVMWIMRQQQQQQQQQQQRYHSRYYSTTTSDPPTSVSAAVRWFSSDDSEKKRKVKHKTQEDKDKDAPAAEEASKDEDAASKMKEEPAASSSSAKKDTDDDPCPPWMNPLHHNNPDMELEKIFEEDFAPGEEMQYQPAPPLEDPDNPDKVLASQELYDLADEIVNLSMLEMRELVDKIGNHFGFEKPPFTGPGRGDGGDGGDGDGESEAEAEAAPEKTAFDIKLVSFDAKSKIKVIKEVRALAHLGLKEAKEMVEGAPKVVMKDIGKEQAEELKEKLEAVGAEIEIV